MVLRRIAGDTRAFSGGLFEVQHDHGGQWLGTQESRSLCLAEDELLGVAGRRKDEN